MRTSTSTDTADEDARAETREALQRSLDRRG